MIQSALSKQKSQPASHFADNSQASPLRGSRSSVRFCVGIYDSCINMAGVTEITGFWNIAQLPEEFTGVWRYIHSCLLIAIDVLLMSFSTCE